MLIVQYYSSVPWSFVMVYWSVQYGNWSVMDCSIGHAHFLVYSILVVSMSGLV